ncbi:thioredoxin [Streptomyces hiroshimensis]|uniref:Thioredoxin n=1 Tax=Streptomyces hiroshimensis TaxID=66424 RepID=A0ABQ2Y6P7_9ACTN|nr:thioredoxin [Streptomyces hiroshimensis]GGX67200.1 thioredoxin [Streptomyces hiroshimensis]
MAGEIIHVGDASLEGDAIKSDMTVILHFWAEWSGPCKTLAPLLEDIAPEYAGKVTIAKINVDDNQATPAQFGARSIPTLILFKNGAAAAQKAGAMSKSQLKAFLDSHL